MRNGHAELSCRALAMAARAGRSGMKRVLRSGAMFVVRRIVHTCPGPSAEAAAAADSQVLSRSHVLISSFSSSASRAAPSACSSSFPAALAVTDGVVDALRRGTVTHGNSHAFNSGFRRPVERALFSSQTSPPPDSPPPSLPPPPPPHHPVNPPDATNPDPVTLQEQWRYATRMYSTWYAHAWGTAILAGLSFYALGWFIKGENPLQFGTREKKQEEVLNPK